jgi:hypothetical protein
VITHAICDAPSARLALALNPALLRRTKAAVIGPTLGGAVAATLQPRLHCSQPRIGSVQSPPCMHGSIHDLI